MNKVREVRQSVTPGRSLGRARPGAGRKSIVILDFGSQYTQLLARRIRELGVYCEILPFNTSQEALLAAHPLGIILSGGPASVTAEAAPQLPTWLFELQLPLLGVCYGMQAMASALGGEVHCSSVSEYGYAEVTEVAPCILFDGLKSKQLDVWMSHGDKVIRLPAGFNVVAHTQDAPIAAMGDEKRHWYGVQFHPEVTHTTQGKAMLSNFVFGVCHAERNWTHQLILENLIQTVKEQVGEERVILGLSGGVDSSVVAALLHRAIGPQLQCVFVDNGLLRQNEVDEVRTLFTAHLGVCVTVVDARELFLSALKGLSCPEEKRKKIGHVFIEVFEAQAKNMQGIKWLAQGTIYPDVIESAQANLGQSAHVIKSHHNVGGAASASSA